MMSRQMAASAYCLPWVLMICSKYIFTSPMALLSMVASVALGLNISSIKGDNSPKENSDSTVAKMVQRR